LRHYKNSNSSQEKRELIESMRKKLVKLKKKVLKDESYLKEQIILVTQQERTRVTLEEKLLPLYNQRGCHGDALAEIVEELQEVARLGTLSDGSRPKIRFKYGNEIEPKPVEWLWDRWLPKSMVVLLDGDPGNCKSTITVKIAGRLSQRGHKVMFFSAEDDAEAVIVPRLLEVKADMSRVMIEAFDDEEDEEQRKEMRDTFFQLKDAGLEILEEFLQAERPSLVIIDPLFSYLGGRKDALDPVVISNITRKLTRLARKYGCTFLLIRHLTKDSKGKSIYLGQGPMALIGGARHALFAGCHPKDPNDRALAVYKSNVGPEGITMGFKIVVKKRTFKGKEAEVVKVRWTGKTDLTVIKMTGSEKGESKLDEALRFYRIKLAGGPAEAAKVKEEGLREGVSDDAQRRARENLGVKTVRDGFGGPVYWELRGE